MVVPDQSGTQAGLQEVRLGMFHWNVRTDQLTLELRAQEVFGLPRVVDLKEVLAIIHPDDVDHVRAKIASLRGELARCELKFRIQHARCGLRALQTVSVGIAGNDGMPQHRYGAVNDVTEQKAARAERERLLKQLRAERERLRQVFMQAPVAVAVFRGPELIVELANPLCRALTEREDVLNRPLAEVVPELGKDVFDALQQVRETGESYKAAAWHIPYDANGDGVPEDHWFNVAYEPLHEINGTVSGVVAVFNEVTEHVRTRQELERTNRGLQEFTYVASHDLQEPLRTVHIYSELLINSLQGKATNEQEQYASIIQQNVRRMETLIKDLLAYSRAVHAEADNVSTTDLNEALRHALTAVQQRVEETDAKIIASLLPTVRGETQQLTQVFQNLLGNALKYRKPDEAPIISIAASPHQHTWTVSITDNGIGFDQKQAIKIFGLFKRLHHHKDYPGTGLGLAICKRIIERYGGTLWAESTPGQGATFSFTLPAAF